MPSTPFIGVRSSWLTEDTKSSLSGCTARRSRISRMIAATPISSPAAFVIGATLADTSTRRPSFRSRTVSKGSTGSPRRSRASICNCSSPRSGGPMIVIGWPIASAA